MRKTVWFGRIWIFALCLALILPMGMPVGAAEEEIYLRPIAGGVAQVAMTDDHIAVLRSDGTVAATGNNDWGQCAVSKWSRIVKIWAGPGVTLGLTDTGELLNTAGTMGGWKNIVDVDVAAVTTGSMTVVVGLKGDGTAVSMGVNSRGTVPLGKDVFNVTGWTNIVQVLVRERVYGLKDDGTVLEAGAKGQESPDNPVSGWTGIRKLVKTDTCIFGITQEGTVLAEKNIPGIEAWENVVKIIPGSNGCVYALTADGQLLSAGEGSVDCSGLSGLVNAAVGAGRAVGLKADGSVVFAPEPQMDWKTRSRWNNTEELVFTPGGSVVAALQKDGTVVAADMDDLSSPGVCDGWSKVAKLFCSGDLWLGVKEDGSLICSSSGMDLSGLTAGVKNTRPPEKSVSLIGAGLYHSIYVRSDGKVSGAGQSSLGRLDVDGWTEIVAVAAAAHTVGLKANGTVVAVGPNGSGQCDLSHWRDIVDIGAGYLNTVGLTSDGTVVVAGGNDYGQLNLTGRQGIVDVAAGGATVYAVTNKGAVYCAGSDVYGQAQVEDWAGIVAISAGTSHVVGLRADGTVVAAGNNDNGQCDVEEWTDIVAVAAGSTHTVGLKSNGTVVYAGGNAFGQSDVLEWTDVIAISAGAYHTLGLTASGKILTAGSNEYGQCDVAY